jgi:hypothetical protein
MGSFHGNGNLVTINQNELFVSQTTDFKITSVSGTVDNNYIKTFQFGYSYNICNPFVSIVKKTTPILNKNEQTTGFYLMFNKTNDFL